ncbi:MAG TPA: YbaK/EbsC family protein, partial [Sphingomicrobium sp.]|nr:YbaK/EbsC family protein [Sphingomicrobium sp.]
GAEYDVIRHVPTKSSLENARSCDIPAEQVAKAVLLDTAEDDHLLAVLPSDRRVELNELRSELGSKPRLADEEEIKDIFVDCDVGAIPPVGYGLKTIVDDSLEEQPDIYFEAGDHRSLVHMERSEFKRVMQDARHGQFSEPWLVD